MVKSACGIEAVYMCFNGTGIWGGETICHAMLKTCHTATAAPSDFKLGQKLWRQSEHGVVCRTLAPEGC